MLSKTIKRGEIYQAELGYQTGSIQAGSRPVAIVSNDINNKFSPTVNVLPITSRTKNNIPVHVMVGITEGLPQPSTILTEQMVTINKDQLKNYIGSCSNYKMYEIENAILLQVGISAEIHTGLNVG